MSDEELQKCIMWLPNKGFQIFVINNWPGSGKTEMFKGGFKKLNDPLRHF